MPDDVEDIAAFYNENPGREHRRLEEQQLERDLTWRYLDAHLPSGGAVLDVGAGTGRYSIPLCQRGYRVTAVDLAAALVDQSRAFAAAEGIEESIQFLVADARDLSELDGQEFDALLMMGPLYHLVDESDRRKTLEEAYRRLKAGGVLFSSMLSRFGVLGDLMKRVPEWVEDQAQVRALLKHGCRPEGSPRGGFRGYFARVSEVIPLHEKAGFETLNLVGVEPAISADDDSYNQLEGRQRELWLDVLQEIGSERSIIAASRHLLYIGRKR